jgi:Na+/H+-dicarboxylate symporter
VPLRQINAKNINAEENLMKNKKMPLAMQIFIALVLAIAAGLLLQNYADFTNEYIKPFGTIFLNLLKFIVVPIVLLSILGGVISMSDIKKVGSIGVKTILYYLCTTAFATAIGLAGGRIFEGTFPMISTTDLSYEASETTNLMDTLVNIFPSNCITPFSEASMLQVIVIALMIGFSIILVGKEAEPVVKLIGSLNAVFMKCMELILKLSPIGVFCLLCPVVATNGAMIIGSLAMVLLAAYVCYAVHAIVIYSGAVRILAKMSPIEFFKGMLPAMMFAFSSASSVGTLPINLECTQKLGASKEVSSFVLPLGATINMDGTAIYQGVCAVFIAACYGIHLTLPQMLTIVLTATLASIGTAGVPGSGMVMLTMVLSSVGLPVEGIALVAGVDRIFDMGRTVVNITGDASCAVIVSRMEDRKKAK